VFCHCVFRRNRPMPIWASSVRYSMSWMRQRRGLILLNLRSTSLEPKVVIQVPR